MDERKWLEAADPGPMLTFLRQSGKFSERKARLFAVACCRHLFRLVRVNRRDERAVDVAERYADGNASALELQEASAGTTPDWTAAFACQEAASPAGGLDAADAAADNAAWEAGSHAAALVDADEDDPSFDIGQEAERTAQAALLRCIFGNPFKPTPTTAEGVLAWNDGIAVKMAQGIYEERDFSPERMGVLADALEEGGYATAELLGHLRSDGPHARGCFAIDLVLNKS